MINIFSYMNKYEILETIGEGEYGVVLKAKNKQTSQLVAIKKFKQDDSDEQNKRVILRQVKILKTLNHDNIIELKEAFRKKGKIYLVCEYVQKNLLQILEQGSINPSQVRNYTLQLLKGLHYMHSLNIIHRDIKPQNVLIGKDGRVKICDLGFARSIPSNGYMTDYVATRWYRPPELLIGKDDYDKSIDIWATGCVMAEMIDGEPLFGGENDLDQLYLIQKCLGPLTQKHQEFFLKNPKFIGMRFPQIHSLESIDRRYFGKIDKLGLDLLKKMLRMEPKNRITVEEALNHPYFHRAGSVSETDVKRNRHQELIQVSESPMEDNHSYYHAHQIQGKLHLPINNFLQDKGKQEKIGINKVTGLNKLKKGDVAANSNGSNLHQTNIFNKETNDDTAFAPKGKSLGNKKAPATSIRQKYAGLASQKHNKNFLKNKHEHLLNKLQPNLQVDEYYEQKWEQQQQETKIQTDINASQTKRQPTIEPNKKQEKKSKRPRRENMNIVFNNNTYNVNIVDPYAHQ